MTASRRATGLHLGAGGMVRIAQIEAQDAGVHLLHAAEFAWDHTPGACAPDPEALLSSDCLERLRSLAAPSTLGIALDEPWFQMRRVPLEVAAQDARRTQILWEAGQALHSPSQDYEITSVDSDRSGVWFAIRTGVVLALGELARSVDHQAGPVVPLPRALMAAVSMVRRFRSDVAEHAALAHLQKSRAWLLTLSTPHDPERSCDLTGLDTEPASRNGRSNTDPVEAARRWFAGDRPRAGRRAEREQRFVSGDPQERGASSIPVPGRFLNG